MRNDLVRFEARIVVGDALRVTQDAAQFGISFAAVRVGRVVLSLRGESLIVQAGLRGLASLVMGKLTPDFPLAQWNVLVHFTSAWDCGRDHQVPTHQRECGSVSDSHGGEISNCR